MLTNLCIPKYAKKFKKPSNPQNEFLTLREYLQLSKYVILRYADGFVPNLAYSMARNDDAVSFVAEKIMMNDWQSNKATHFSRLSWRLRSGRWSILDYIKLGSRQQQTISIGSLNQTDYLTDGFLNSASLEYRKKSQQLSEDKYVSEITFVEGLDEQKVFRDRFENLLYYACLSNRQEQVVRLKFKDGYSEKEIAAQLGLTIQAVNLYLQNAYWKIRQVA